MFKIIFPYQLHLHILQLEEYSIPHFLRWIKNNFFKRTILNKKKLVWTSKAKLLFFISIILFVLLSIVLVYKLYFIGFLLAVIIATQPYIFLSVATLLLKPFEIYHRNITKQKTVKKIKSFKNLKVIGITGSYGKTSVKEFLYAILKHNFKVLKTPGSYNTVYGIAKVVDLELDDSYDFFIAEMGAYKRGDIRELCEMAHPTYGILTGINEQHLETFGGINNTIRGKFELIQSIPSSGFGVVNNDNQNIRNNYKSYKTKIIPYGFSEDLFSIKSQTTTESGTSFSLILDGKKYDTKTKLIGNSNLQNILGAATMAFLLDMKPQAIIEAIALIESVEHRFEIKKLDNGTVIIDDAYNSNITGFKEALITLKNFGQTKIIATPGIVQLGNKTIELHKPLGKLADEICDYIFLVGKSDRTQGLAEGIENKNKIYYIDDVKSLWTEIEKLHIKNPVILLENDVPDNF